MAKESVFGRDFGPTLRRLMFDRGMSQREMCRRTGMSTTALSRIMTGHVSAPRLDMAMKMATALGIGIEQLASEYERDCRASRG